MKKNAKPFGFNLSPFDRRIVNSLRLSLEDIMPEIMNDHNLTERNGYGQFRWNVIIAQLRDECRHIGWFDFGICPRGGWKTPVLFYPASHNIITFMTEDTFYSIQRRKDKAKHYLCGAASFNQNVEPEYEQLRLELPSISSDTDEWVAKSREQLAHAIHASVGDIEGHILVLFDVRADKLLTVHAVRLTKNLELSTEKEDWSCYIRMPYTTNQEVDPQQCSENDEENLVELL